MKNSAALVVVKKEAEAQETIVHPVDRLSMAAHKAAFMAEAIPALWGHKDSDYSGNESIMGGAQFLLAEIAEELSALTAVFADEGKTA